jgi:hypothetical protein
VSKSLGKSGDITTAQHCRAEVAKSIAPSPGTVKIPLSTASESEESHGIIGWRGLMRRACTLLAHQNDQTAHLTTIALDNGGKFGALGGRERGGHTGLAILLRSPGGIDGFESAFLQRGVCEFSVPER